MTCLEFVGDEKVALIQLLHCLVLGGNFHSDWIVE